MVRADVRDFPAHRRVTRNQAVVQRVFLGMMQQIRIILKVLKGEMQKGQIRHLRASARLGLTLDQTQQLGLIPMFLVKFV